MNLEELKGLIEMTLSISDISARVKSNKYFHARVIFVQIAVDGGFCSNKVLIGRYIKRSREIVGYSLRQHEIMKVQDKIYGNKYMRVLEKLDDKAIAGMLRLQFFDVYNRSYNIDAARALLNSIEGVHHADIFELINDRVKPFLKLKGYVDR